MNGNLWDHVCINQTLCWISQHLYKIIEGQHFKNIWCRLEIFQKKLANRALKEIKDVFRK
jgi:hypothetical protein